MQPDMDIRKFAEKLVKGGREAVEWERRKLEWIMQEQEKQASQQTEKKAEAKSEAA